uniref:Uncharacterized protein n=1 Tax=Knipowitschia caucasica TaxID=637954 RepID=A0AAV2MLP9_KNICA
MNCAIQINLTLHLCCQSEELSLTEGEEEEEDWLKMCESCGHVGCEPERFVQFLCLPAEGATSTDTAAVSPVCVHGGEGLWEEDPGHVGVYRSVVVELLEDEEEEEVEEEEILSSGSDPVSSQIHLYNTQQTDHHTDPERSRLSSPVLRPCRPPPPPPIHRSSP